MTVCAAAAPGDPLERPAHTGKVPRDRGDGRAGAADRAHRQPGAHRLHRAQAALGPRARARRLPAACPRCCCPRTTCGCGSDRELATDVSDASGTLLFDVGARTWSEQMLDLLDLPREWFPRALESGSLSGTTSAGLPVAAGAGDQAAGALGVGVDRPGSVSVALGTSGVVFGVLPALAADPRGTAHTFCHAVPGTWHAMGVMLSAAGALDWLHTSVLPGSSIEALLEAAAAWEPGCRGPPVRPVPVRRANPARRPRRAGRLRGLALSHDTGALVRAVLEGVAYGLRDSLDLLAAWAFARRRAGSEAAAAAASCGGGSLRRCSTCRSRSPLRG